MKIASLTALGIAATVATCAMGLVAVSGMLVGARLTSDVTERMVAEVRHSVGTIGARVEAVRAAAASIADGPVLDAWLEEAPLAGPERSAGEDAAGTAAGDGGEDAAAGTGSAADAAQQDGPPGAAAGNAPTDSAPGAGSTADDAGSGGATETTANEGSTDGAAGAGATADTARPAGSETGANAPSTDSTPGAETRADTARPDGTAAATSEGERAAGTDAPAPSAPAATDPRRMLEARLAATLANNPGWFQARFIDTAGQEVARVDRVGDSIVVAPLARLQDKAGRPYVPALLQLGPGDVHVSPIDLNREFGAIERPIRATMRVAVPVFDTGGRRRGGIVINLDPASVLPDTLAIDATVFAVSANGQFILHPRPEARFGVDLETGVTLSSLFGLAPDDPRFETPGTIRLTDQGAGDATLLTAHAAWQPADAGPEARVLFLAAQPLDVALAPVTGQIRTLSLAIIGVAALACLLGWLAAHRLTRRVSDVAASARAIAAGSDELVPESGPDEMVDMAEAINSMTLRLRALLAREVEAREMLRIANAELKRSNDELENYARIAAHDLRAPLRALADLPTWIEEDMPELPEDVQAHLDEMRQQVARLEELTDSLLRYSVFGTEDSALSRVDAEEIARRVVEGIALPPGFSVTLAGFPPPFDAVPTEIEIAFRNLVQNAVRHHDRDSGRIAIGGAARGSEVDLYVADDGPGIPPEHHDRVLQPLQSLRRGDGGTGLGLSFVDKIARRWRGRVEIESEAGRRGTTVHLVLPREPDPDRAAGTLAA